MVPDGSEKITKFGFVRQGMVGAGAARCRWKAGSIPSFPTNGVLHAFYLQLYRPPRATK